MGYETGGKFEGGDDCKLEQFLEPCAVSGLN